jgi:MarR family transcriptional regulator for hemolysin
MTPPTRPPLGIRLVGTAKSVSRAFDEAMTAAGGSSSIWLILIAVKTRTEANQRELAEAVGIQGATLTHHLNGMERDGLLTRRRDPANRRVHVVELTEEGERMFQRLRGTAMDFDRRLRRDLTDEDIAAFERVLTRLTANVRPS